MRFYTQAYAKADLRVAAIGRGLREDVKVERGGGVCTATSPVHLLERRNAELIDDKRMGAGGKLGVPCLYRSRGHKFEGGGGS